MKKDILILFGVGDLFCSKTSFRNIKSGARIEQESKKVVAKNGHYGFLRVYEPSDSFEKLIRLRMLSNQKS